VLKGAFPLRLAITTERLTGADGKQRHDTQSDRLLAAVAREIIGWRSKQGWQQIGRALRTRSRMVSSAVHLEATIGLC